MERLSFETVFCFSYKRLVFGSLVLILPDTVQVVFAVSIVLSSKD